MSHALDRSSPPDSRRPGPPGGPWLPGVGAALLLVGCAAPLPGEPPPLAGMEEPLALRREPDDEQRRLALDPGGFSGIVVRDARDSLAALTGAPTGLEVTRVVENSPAHVAGVEVGDLLLEWRDVDGPDDWSELRWPADWRALELESRGGTRIALRLDRAGRAAETELVFEARVAPAPRDAVERFREEERVGVVLRTATEVEAREAGLAPGAGAVLVGLTRESPWRAAGLAFGDLVVGLGGRPLDHPRQLIQAIRDAEAEGSLALEVLRGGERTRVDAPLSRRLRTTSEVRLPPLFTHRSERGRTTTSVLLGAFRRESTAAAWRVRILWFASFGGGDADRLEELAPEAGS